MSFALVTWVNREVPFVKSAVEKLTLRALFVKEVFMEHL
jgi:hypothetical protein